MRVLGVLVAATVVIGLVSVGSAAAQDQPVEPPAIRVRVNHSTWAETSCQMHGGLNSYWTRPVDGLTTLRDLDSFGLSPVGDPNGVPWNTSAAFPDPLALHAGMFPSATDAPFNWVGQNTSRSWLESVGSGASTSYLRSSEYSKVNWTTVFGQRVPVSAALRLPMPGPAQVKFNTSSNDNRAIFLDSHNCMLYEAFGWDRLNGFFNTRRANRLTAYDLDANHRRRSSAEGWLAPPFNASAGRLASPLTPENPNNIDGVVIHGPRSAATSAGGSGLSAALGTVRIDEIFQTPHPTDKTVAANREIRHAISAVIPAWHVSERPVPDGSDTASAPPDSPFVWPALTSDGCGADDENNNGVGDGACTGDVVGQASSPDHIPMGSRLRLSSDKCDDTYLQDQTRKIIEALCTYGIVVTDSSNHFSIAVEGSYHKPNVLTPADSKWDKHANSELKNSISLRDFEVVDAESVASVDTDVVWPTAWAQVIAHRDAGNAINAGWYDGWFWGRVSGCDRTGLYDPSTNPRPDCVDTALAAVDQVANSSSYFETTPSP